MRMYREDKTWWVDQRDKDNLHFFTVIIWFLLGVLAFIFIPLFGIVLLSLFWIISILMLKDTLHSRAIWTDKVSNGYTPVGETWLDWVFEIVAPWLN